MCLVATHWTPEFENCVSSLRFHGYTYKVLGWGETWKGWKWRTKIQLDFLQSLKSNSVVVMMDAYDTLAVKNESELYQSFHAFNVPVLVSSEWWPFGGNVGFLGTWWKNQLLKQSSYKYCNAGCIMGYSQSLVPLYTHSNKYADDQVGLADYMNSTYNLIHLDSSSQIFQTVNWFDVNTPSPSAFFHHYPGPMLKLGLFPQYSREARKQLKFKARIPSCNHTFILVLFFILFVLLL